MPDSRLSSRGLALAVSAYGLWGFLPVYFLLLDPSTPVEIALSILAEMRAVLEGRSGGMLREWRGSIHGGAEDGERGFLTEDRVLPVAVS